MAETEYMVRGKGYLRGKDDIETAGGQGRQGHAGAGPRHRPGRTGADERRGLTELNGEGEVVSGIAMARYGQNALEVIHNLKEKIAEIGAGLPEGRFRGDRLRPLRIDPPRHRHPEDGHAAGGKPDRRAGLRGLPAARAQLRWSPS